MDAVPAEHTDASHMIAYLTHSSDCHEHNAVKVVASDVTIAVRAYRIQAVHVTGVCGSITINGSENRAIRRQVCEYLAYKYMFTQYWTFNVSFT